MSGIALFVPDKDMYAHAEKLIKKYKNSHVSSLKLIQKEDVTTEARKAIDQGTNIIIARGRQASEIRNNTNVTVINIVMTAQELGLLIMKAKSLINKEQLSIGLFGWGDMFCDTTYFDELFNISLKHFNLNENEEWRNVIFNAANEHLDVIIGGRSVLECANQLGIPGIYLSSTGESLDVAIHSAESLYRMAEIEYAQFSTVLDSSSNGIIKLSTNGKILIINRVMENIIGQTSDQLVGTSIDQLFSELNHDKISAVLNGTLDNFTTILTYLGQELVLIVEPIIVDNNNIEGAIMSFNRLRRRNVTDKETMAKHFLCGHVAQATFDDISINMKGLHKVIELAKLYALSSSPMLIESLSGPELDIITQGIHNYGMRKNGPFIMINMAGMTEDQQSEALFGNPETKENGALLNADHGTLVIHSIDKLSLPMQYNFIKALRTKRLSSDNNPTNIKVFDTRIIACTSKNLMELRQNFRFRSDLYFTFNSLRLKIPNLKDRPEDVEYLLSTFTKHYMQQYSRYHILSSRAKKVLLEYPWEGNSIQLQSFCERMILTAQSRSITEEYVRSLLDELYHSNFGVYEDPIDDRSKDDTFIESTEDPMQELIVKTLKKYNGSRKLTAKELQISTTTLWRKLKKYGLTDD